MIKHYWPMLTSASLSASLALAILLAACGSPANTALPPTSVPTKPANNNSSAPGTVVASGVVAPVQTSQMGFVISAPVKEVAMKEGDKVQSGQTLVVLDTPDLEFLVVQAEAALRSAQADAELQRYRRKVTNRAGKTLYLSGPHEKIEVADAKVQQAQATLESAQAFLTQGTLLAPYNGTVVQVNVAPGEFVQPSQVVAVIGDLEHLQIETTDLSERDIAQVKIGQSATAFVEALNTELNGKVTTITPMADTVGGDVVYKVTITLDEQPEGLLWGMNTEVKIMTE
jgi:HlyD family secretion protein